MSLSQVNLSLIKAGYFHSEKATSIRSTIKYKLHIIGHKADITYVNINKSSWKTSLIDMWWSFLFL